MCGLLLIFCNHSTANAEIDTSGTDESKNQEAIISDSSNLTIMEQPTEELKENEHVIEESNSSEFAQEEAVLKGVAEITPKYPKVGDLTEFTFTITNMGEEGSLATEVELSSIAYSYIIPDFVYIKYVTSSENHEVKVPAEEFKSGYQFEDIEGGDYVEIRYSGIPWNNHLENPERNDLSVDYKPRKGDFEKSTLQILGGYYVTSGHFGFVEVPPVLEFKSTPLITNENSQVIDRAVSNWGICVEDYRGTYENEVQEIFADRNDWEITATAELFADSNGNKVPTDILSIAYLENGTTIAELSNQEVSIAQHSVVGETPLDNHEFTVSWEEMDGLKATVHNPKELKTNVEYHAKINFDLRTAP
ncbi:hypothetical protein RV06_GL001639 [Enterococcus haemoperoxidus]|nr:hypothetical protein RV06_GL001639 [Enterococcus haemoperoxidus]